MYHTIFSSGIADHTARRLPTLSLLSLAVAVSLATPAVAAEATCTTTGTQQATGNNAVACGDNAQATGANAIAIGSAAQANADNTIVIGSGVNADISNSVYLGNQAVGTADLTNTTAGMTDISGNYAATQPTGIVTIGSDGDEKRIQNVAAGLVSIGSTDAINGSQLFATNQNVAANAAAIGSNTNRITNNTQNIAQNTQNISNNTTTINNIADNVSKGINIAGNQGSSNSQLGDTITISGGLAADQSASNQNVRTVVNNGTVDIQIAERPQFTEVVLSEALTLNQGANVDMGGNQVHNVADGTAPNDAVNVSQLQRVDNRISDVDDDAAAGIAAAMATAALPQPYEAGKSMFSAAMGAYRDQQALSIGLSSISDNGQWIIKSAINADTQSNFGASVGVGYQW